MSTLMILFQTLINSQAFLALLNSSQNADLFHSKFCLFNITLRPDLKVTYSNAGISNVAGGRSTDALSVVS